jgi:hypothetical protein
VQIVEELPLTFALAQIAPLLARYVNNSVMHQSQCKGKKKKGVPLGYNGQALGAPRNEGDCTSQESGSYDGESASAEEDSNSSSTTTLVKRSKGPGKTDKSDKTLSTSASGIGSLYEDGLEGLIGSDSEEAQEQLRWDSWLRLGQCHVLESVRVEDHNLRAPGRRRR